METNQRERGRKKDVECPVEATLTVIGGRWKVLILRELMTGPKRFGQLHRALAGITQKMLTQQLREMERNGILTRTVYPQIPPRVEYALTDLGKSLRPVLAAMHRWGVRHLDRQKEKSPAMIQEARAFKK